MRVERQKDKLIIHNPEDFNVVQTLDCGQIFRYVIVGNEADVYSLDKYAHLITYSDRIEINSRDIEYFYHFFDLARDYGKIKKKLREDEFLSKAVDYGYGIRIINNDVYEMIISFIISANNNIVRIKRSIEYLCRHFGEDLGGYFAFPTLKKLKTASIEDFKIAGLGYRAEQIYDTVQRLTEDQLEQLKTMSHEDRFRFLVSLKGIGEKVANCILLFGLHEKDVFPVDTWINKVYNTLNGTIEKDRRKITRELTSRYGSLSGYAQQYFFYYYRDNKIK